MFLAAIRFVPAQHNSSLRTGWLGKDFVGERKRKRLAGGQAQRKLGTRGPAGSGLHGHALTTIFGPADWEHKCG